MEPATADIRLNRIKNQIINSEKKYTPLILSKLSLYLVGTIFFGLLGLLLIFTMTLHIIKFISVESYLLDISLSLFALTCAAFCLKKLNKELEPITKSKTETLEQLILYELISNFQKLQDCDKSNIISTLLSMDLTNYLNSLKKMNENHILITLQSGIEDTFDNMSSKNFYQDAVYKGIKELINNSYKNSEFLSKSTNLSKKNINRMLEILEEIEITPRTTL